MRDLPVRALADLSLQAMFVVVGARGAGGFAGFGLGSTADGLLTRSTAPVVIVRDAEASGPVVVGVDGSSASAAALRLAVGEARARDGPLHVLTAWEKPALAAWALQSESPVFAKLGGRAEKVLGEALQAIDIAGIDV